MPKEPQPLKPTEPAYAFAKLVRKHLGLLDWKHEDLALHAGVSKSQISVWIGEAARKPPKPVVSRMAWAIAGGYDGALSTGGEAKAVKRKGGKIRDGRDKFDEILSELLDAAGYNRGKGLRQNRVWERLTGLSEDIPPPDDDDDAALDVRKYHKLRFGYVDSPPLITILPGDSEPSGVAADICRQLAELIGVECEFVRSYWDQLSIRLADGGVDVIAPMAFYYPRRMIDMRFTRAIPALRCGINCIINKGQVKDVLKKGARINDRHVGDIDFSKLLLEYSEGTVAGYISRSFAPGREATKRTELRRYGKEPSEGYPRKSPRDRAAEAKGGRSAERQLEDWEEVVANPVDSATQRVRGYLIGQLVCHAAITGESPFSKDADILIPLEESRLRLPYAMAVRHSETILHRVIDDALMLLFNDPVRMHDIFRPDLPALHQARLITGSDVPKWMKKLMDELDLRSNLPSWQAE